MTHYKHLACVLSSLLLLSACGQQAQNQLPPIKGGFDQKGNTLYVALGQQGMAVIDADQFQKVGVTALAAGYYAHHPALSPDGKRIALACPSVDFATGHDVPAGANAKTALYLFDSRTNDSLAATLVDGTVHNLAFVSDSSAVAFSILERGVMSLGDPAALSVSGEVAVGKTPLEVTPVPGSKLVLVANADDGSVSVVDAGSRKVTKTLSVGKNPIGAWLGKDGRAYVTSEEDKMLSAIDLSALVVAQSMAVPGTPGLALTTIDGKELWVTEENLGKVLILKTADLSMVAEITVGKAPHFLVANPDGKTMYLTDQEDGKVYALDVAGRTVRGSVEVGGKPNGIIFRAPL